MTSPLPAWKSYEDFIFEKLHAEFPDCVVCSDQKLLGRFSQIRRQVDVLIQGSLGGHPVLGVIECKYFNKKIDIKAVDAFAGFLDDLNANLGIMITNYGYSQAAIQRTFGTRIKLEIVNWNDFADHDFHWDGCLCEPSADHDFSLHDWWIAAYQGPSAVQKHCDVGCCKYCQSVTVKCRQCQQLLYFDKDLEEKSCRCGSRIKVDKVFSKRGLFRPRIKLLSSSQ